MYTKRALLILALMCVKISFGRETKNPNESYDGANSLPLFDVASMFIKEALNHQNVNDENGKSNAIESLTSVIGSLLEANEGKIGGEGAMKIVLSGIGSLLTSSANRKQHNEKSYNGFNPSVISNIIEMFTATDDTENDYEGHARDERDNDSSIGIDSIVHIASAFMKESQSSLKSFKKEKRAITEDVIDNNIETEHNNIWTLLPLAIQTISSFAGPEGQKTQQNHKDHAWSLPPFLEHIHVLWDHFSNSEFAEALYEKSGVNAILKGFRKRDGKLDLENLFESLNNQQFRRRWIKSATLYLSDWASHLANPKIYLKYIEAMQLMVNTYLKANGYPKTTFFDISRPSETIANLLDHVIKNHLSVKINSRQYVDPAVAYAKELLKLGQARGPLQLNATQLSDALTDTLNLEVIEPVLKVHRAYRYILKSPHCDRYVLCMLQAPEANKQQNPQEIISGVSPKILKVGSMVAAFLISTTTGAPFWSLYNVVSSSNKCEENYSVDCVGFHEGEARVRKDYIHSEL